jgi:hypothetical protein
VIRPGMTLPTQYSTRHMRVRAARGPASQFPCADECGVQAQDWSQTHGTSGEDPEHYAPRCIKCHRAYDTDSTPRGEAHVNAKLTEARVRAIRASANVSVNRLAALHGVSRPTINRVLNGESWRHVK